MKRSLLVSAMLVGALRPSYGQDAATKAQAADLFDQGRADMQAGRAADACPKFEESLRLDKQTGTRLNLANCYEQIGRLASAWAIYSEVVDLAKDEPDRVYARAAADRLKPRVPRLEIKAPDAIDVEVKLDGVPIAPGLPRMVDPGPHRVEASAPGRASKTVDVTAVQNTTVPVQIPTLEPLAPTPVVTTPTPPVTSQSVASTVPIAEEPNSVPVDSVDEMGSRPARAWLGLSVAAVGAVLVGVGAWAGLDARSKGNEARSLGCDDNLTNCPSDALPTANAAYDRASLSTTLVVSGVGAIGVGALLWFTAPADSVARGVAVRPTTRGVAFSFSTRW